ncbi:DUF3291 domain-containing protein [Oceanomicrobium pacificus]|uniref:DUF3291 domain-containing protein n=1 Tax=Oceanomicrobium pacificus TaxID=2692916 RepID=A0A6B0TWS1_9RHOB|nr:DUF3291 domain-containing protein [Oceanomicrobium pacificus]MXU65604.1 DUF3291 domain-containing protein [Oceanomicrobium pacificus]
MVQPAGHNLAQLNIGRLVADPGDPAVADFVEAIDRVNGLGKRMPGFVWMMGGSGAPNAGNLETKIDDDPRFVSNLTVWTDAASLENFVWNTVHRQFYERRAEWFRVMDGMHLVMWWVPEGHEPTLEEGLARLAHLEEQGDSDHAFGWRWLQDANLWRTHQCGAVAAE